MKKVLSKHYSFMVPFVTTIIAIITGIVHYITIDDIDMLQMAESFNINSHSEQLIFSNVVIGFILKFFYSVLPLISWYTVFGILIIFIDFYILFSLVKKYDFKILSCLILTLIMLFVFSNRSFTLLSFLTAFTAIVFVSERKMQFSKEGIINIIIAFLLFTTAFFIRNGSSVVLYLVLSIVIVMLAVSIKNKSIKIYSALIIVLIIVVSSSFCTIIQNTYNKQIPEEIYYNEFHEYRGPIIDYNRKSYSEQKDVLEANNISENDLNTYMHWIFGDKEVFSANKEKAIVDSYTFNDKYETNPIELVKTLLKVKTRLLVIIAFIFISLLIIFVLNKKRRLEVLSVFIVISLNIGYLFISRRPLTRIIINLIVLSLILYLFTVIKNKEDFKYKKILSKLETKSCKKALSIICIITITFSFICTSYIVNNIRKHEQVTQETIEYIDNHNENIYIYDWVYLQSYFCQYFDSIILKRMPNNMTSLLGGCSIYSYYWHSQMDNYHFTDYKDKSIHILLEDNVKYVGGNETPEFIATYFKEHYNLDVEYTIVESFNDSGLYIYEFSIEQ